MKAFLTRFALLVACLAAMAPGAIAQDQKQDKKPETAKPETPKSDAAKPDSSKQAAAPKPAWNPYGVFLQYKLLATLDEDANGTVTFKELEGCVERLKKLDANADGKLDSEEFLKPPPLSPMVANFGAVKALDADKDGVLSDKEIAGAVETLKGLDKNKDGKLSSSEYAMNSPMSMGGGGGGGRGGGRAMPSPEEFMKQNDKNSDGKVAKDELTGPAANFFDRMDSDKDGFVTLEEVKASRERMRQQGGGGATSGAAPGGGAPKAETPKTETPKKSS